MSKRIALLFPGYGSQYVGMGKELYDEYRVVQEYFEEASNCLDVNFVKLCFASSDSELGKMANAYTSLFLLGGAVTALLKENGINPDVVAGYNNGESAALYAGGCFSFPDGLYLLNKFASFYHSVENMDFAAIHIQGVATTELEQACRKVNSIEGSVFIAIYTSETDHIVVGNSEKIDRIRDIFGAESGVTIEGTSMNVGLHCQLADGLLVQCRPSLEKVDFKDLSIPVISNVDGKKVTDGAQMRDYFIAHINSPLMFSTVLHALVEYDTIIVACPGKQLGLMVKDQYPEKTVMILDNKADFEEIKKLLCVEKSITESDTL